MKKNVGLIVHRWKIAQEKLDEKLDQEPYGEKIPKPIILPNGARKWVFN